MNMLTDQQDFPSVSSPRVEPINLLIAEDTLMGCQLLKDTIKRSRLVLESTHCAITSAQIARVASECAIDVALISEDLQDGSYKGVDVLELLRRLRPGIRSILLVRSIKPELTVAAFRNGAKGVFCRTEPIEALWKCIRAVHKGQVWIDSEQLEVILQVLAQGKPTRVTNGQGSYLLTRREDEVGGLVAEGLTNREIAEKLGLSEHTVGNYLFKIYDKLGISRRVELVLYCANKKQLS